jgi:hypothetical protein
LGTSASRSTPNARTAAGEELAILRLALAERADAGTERRLRALSKSNHIAIPHTLLKALKMHPEMMAILNADPQKRHDPEPVVLVGLHVCVLAVAQTLHVHHPRFSTTD